jgi:hypothetical protein
MLELHNGSLLAITVYKRCETYRSSFVELDAGFVEGELE